jgi:hypothetical protein
MQNYMRETGWSSERVLKCRRKGFAPVLTATQKLTNHPAGLKKQEKTISDVIESSERDATD